MNAMETKVRVELSIPGDDGNVSFRMKEVIRLLTVLGGFRLSARLDGGRVYLLQDHEEPVDSSTVDPAPRREKVSRPYGTPGGPTPPGMVRTPGRADVPESDHSCWRTDGTHEAHCYMRPAPARPLHDVCGHPVCDHVLAQHPAGPDGQPGPCTATVAVGGFETTCACPGYMPVTYTDVSKKVV